MKQIISALLIATLATNAFAFSRTQNWLALSRADNWMTACEQDQQSCYDFVQGVIETARTMAYKQRLSVCIPKDLTASGIMGYVIDTAKKKEYATLTGLPLSDVVIGALEANFPCRPS